MVLPLSRQQHAPNKEASKALLKYTNTNIQISAALHRWSPAWHSHLGLILHTLSSVVSQTKPQWPWATYRQTSFSCTTWRTHGTSGTLKRLHQKECEAMHENHTRQFFINKVFFKKTSLTVSPLWPASPGGPTGPGVPGPPGEPGKPAGPGSPRSPCKAEFQKFYLKRIGLSKEDWSRPKQQNCSTASLLLSNCNLQRYSCCKNLSLSLWWWMLLAS